MNKNNNSWSRLDNAAKIFPSTSNKRDTKVFRFSCELNEPVEQQTLQIALDKTLDIFPVYRCVLKKGLFWYYLENSNIKAIVNKERKQPCSPLYIHNKKTLLFEVSYYRNRINLEVYHALSDGTGAMHFLRTLVFHYLKLKHPKELSNLTSLIDFDASTKQKMDDSFKKYYSKEGQKKLKSKTQFAYRIKSPKLSENRISIIEGVMPLDKVLSVAHNYNASLTVLLSSIFLCSVNKEMSLKDKKKPVILVVPVNLRKYFPSTSIRNFFSVINVGYNFKDYDCELETVIKHISESFKNELTAEQLSLRMNSLAALEHNIFARPIPLPLKNIVLRLANRFSEKERTLSLSNIGKVDMPDELKQYIKLFDVFVSTNILQICMCSFKNNLTISFSSAYIDTDVQKNFFRTLSSFEIPIEITSNQIKAE